jgi:putative solute:sodium symporter small subunit
MASETPDGTDGADAGRSEERPAGHRDVDYLEREVNLLRPSTPFMRDHLRIIWTGFVLWALVVFGPVTLTAVAPGVMTRPMPVLGFPLHYFLVAFGAPTGALVLAAVYTRYRDRLDDKYGIDPATVESESAETGEATATDGGAEP